MGKATPRPKILLLLSSIFIFGLTFITASSEKPVEINITGTVTNISCFNAQDGKIDIEITGAGSGYQVTWDGPGTYSAEDEDISGLAPGIYTVTVSDGENIKESDPFEVNEPNELSINSTETKDVSCNGGNDGSLSVTDVSGGTQPYEYNLTGTYQSSSDFGSLSAGSYTLIVRDANNCETNTTIQINEPNPLQMEPPSTEDISCFGKEDGTATAGNVTGGEGTYLYSLDNSDYQFSNSFTDLSEGDYTIYVKDENDCIAQQDFIINEPSELSATVSSTDVTCFDANNGSISITNPQGGYGQYEFSNDNGQTWQASGEFNDLSSGTYQVLIRDAENQDCEIVLNNNLEITQPDILDANISSENISCFGAGDGSIEITGATGGSESFQYSINGGTDWQNNGSFANLSPGFYQVQIRDQNQTNCVIELDANLEITQPNELSASVDYEDVTCYNANNGSITISNPQGGYGQYEYSNDNGQTWQASGEFNDLSNGNYQVLIRDAENPDCEIILENNLEITQPDILDAEVSSENVSCFGAGDGSIEITAPTGGSGSFQYSINGGADWQNSGSFANLSPGSFQVQIRDQNQTNCVIELDANLEITQPNELSASVTYRNVTCYNASNGRIAISNPQGGYGQYEFSIDNGQSWQASGEFNNLSNGIYQVLIRDAANTGCEIELEGNLEITQPDILNAEVFSQNVSCYGNDDGSIRIDNPTGGHGRYQYSINGGSSWENNGQYSDLSPGIYNIQIRDRDQQSCLIILDENHEITAPDELSITGNTSTPTSCYGGEDGTITAGEVTGGTAPYQFSIDNINFNETGEFEGLSAGSHIIFIVDANGCALQSTINVDEPDKLDAVINKRDVNCFEESDGQISLSNLSGGSGNYEFSIDGGTTWVSSSETFTGLSAGNYQVAIRDTQSPNCVVILHEQFPIGQPESALQIDNFEVTRTTTYGTSTGSAKANPSGGTPGYIYEWREAGSEEVIQNTQTATNIPAGDYEVTVIDRNDCEIVEQVTVYEKIKAPIIPTSICENEEDTLRTSYFEVEDLTAVGGIGPYTYEWNFGAGATPATATGPGPHRVTYDIAENKTISLTVTDSVGESITNTYTQYVGECYVDDCGSNDFSGTDFFIGDANGNPITSSNCGSETNKFIYVDLSSAPTRYSLYIEFIYTLQKENGTTISIKDGGQFYCNEAIPNIAQTIPVNDWECGDLLTIDNVYLTFSNNDKWGCGQGPDPKCFSTNEGSSVNTPLFATLSGNQIMCKGADNGILNVRASGGTPAYDYSLNEDGPFQDETQFLNLSAGTYTVWVRDSKGDKFQTEPFTIEEPQTEITTTITTNEPVCFGDPANATAHPEGGTPFVDENGEEYYEYLWNDINQQQTRVASDLEPGEYTVTVSDANGCQVLEYVTVSQPEQVSKPVAGVDQFFNCGFTTARLEANTPEVGIGTWEIIEGPEDGAFADTSDPTTNFSGSAGTYILEWTIAFENGSCSRTDTVEITFSEECVTLDFDGEDDYIFVGDQLGFSSGNFTMEGWVKPNSIGGTQTIFSKRNSKNLGAGGFDLSINSGSPTFRWGNKSVSTANRVDTDRWYHLAVIFNGSNAQLFVDGIRMANASAENPLAIDAPFLIGAMYNADTPENPQNYFHGWIEEMRLWDKALSTEQLRFLMNQRLDLVQNRGSILPMEIPEGLDFNEDLEAYYPLIATEAGAGITVDLGPNGFDGQLRNIETLQENTAPLPYISADNGTWREDQIWLRPDVWDPPNSRGINGDRINWNIAEISHNISSGSDNIHLLGLLSEENMLTMANDADQNDEYNFGQGLIISHFLRLNGNINLVGESQLVQNEGSILEESSSGYVERDQQGTANSYNYNYWTSPVSAQGSANNSGFIIKNILKDGTDSNNPQDISFAYPHTHADGNYSGNKRISTYWLHKFHGTANTYGEWKWIGANTGLSAAEGFTMKGTSGQARISDRQNYVFRGKPNNGTIRRSISNQENRLLGNPYPSAIDANQFIRDNLKDVNGGNNSQNIFNGALYFWDHFGQENTHVLREYIGGYATYTLAGGVPAASTDTRINNSGDTGDKTPGRYIPVAQGFFVNSVLDDDVSGNFTISGGDVEFRNRQRVFVREDGEDSQFLMAEKPEKGKQQEEQAQYTRDTRFKIRLNFHSPKGYNRQILVTADGWASNEFDLGYDAPLIDNNVEDMFWMINSGRFVIQAVPHFNKNQVLPLGIKIAEEGEFSIRVAETANLPDGTNLYVRDNADSTYYDIKAETFSASLAPGLYEGDYDLVFHDGSKTPKEQPQTGKVTAIYSFDNKELRIRNPELIDIHQVIIYTIAGSRVIDFTNIPTKKEVPLHLEKPLSSAVYVVRIFTENGEYANKIIAKK